MGKKANFGIKRYTPEQDEFHKDIIKVLKLKKHSKISADDCMVVFGRCYATYCLSHLVQEDIIEVKKNGRTFKYDI